MNASKPWPWWPELLVILVISATMAWVVNEARPEPLGWFADFRATVVERATKKGLEVVTPAQAIELAKDGAHLFVDAREPGEFAAGRLPGAVNLPAEALLSGLDAAMSALPPDKTLIVYCSNLACPKSKDLAQGLKELGVAKLMVMPEGLEGWTQAGGQLEVN